MGDFRIVQCFGVKRRPGKPAKICRRRFIWTAADAGRNNFGRRGTQACPHCGTLPDFTHPYNRYLGGELSYEQAVGMMPEWQEEKKRLGK
ncbi:MAG: hypothetical protein GF334_01485 [Candidatus Altiarchaeales archaeon]|nr:hypothetical protein [Candidatus Altiarchaeales archaeon]